MKMNINDMVRVKLTDVGRKIMIEQGLNAYYLPDAEGYTEFHFWELMQFFGSKMYHGNPDLPFETTIYYRETA